MPSYALGLLLWLARPCFALAWPPARPIPAACLAALHNTPRPTCGYGLTTSKPRMWRNSSKLNVATPIADAGLSRRLSGRAGLSSGPPRKLAPKGGHAPAPGPHPTEQLQDGGRSSPPTADASLRGVRRSRLGCQTRV